MITSVYLSNNNVRVVSGSGSANVAKIKKAWHLVLQEGSIINGIVTNETELAAQLKKFWEENKIPVKNVTLVLDSSRMVSKKLELPKVNEKKIYELLPNEFPEVENPELNLYDYMLIKGAGGKEELRAVSVERSYMEEFVQLFAGIGVTLDRIAVGRNCLLHVLCSLKSIRSQNAVFQILDGNSMTSILYRSGNVEYSTQRRIFSDVESSQFATEILRSVSNLEQFQITQGIHEDITNVYLTGVSAETLSACQENIRELESKVKISAMTLEGNIKFPGSMEEACNYLQSIGSLMQEKKAINLIKVSKQKVKKKEKSTGILKMLTLPLILLVGGGAITGALYFQNHVKTMELDELNTYLNDESNLEKVSYATYYEEINQELQNRIMSVASMNDIIASYPLMNSSVVKKVQSCATGYANFTVSSYSASNGLLSINATADEVTKINQFIDRLQDSGLFERLDYTGYTYDEKELAYTINVSCYLAANAGK